MPKTSAATAAPSDPAKAVTRWTDEIDLYERETSTWVTRGKKVVSRYRDERNDAGSKKRQFNILWSSTETMRPALYAKNPKPDIQRRFKDADPVGRVASDILERCATYFVDTDHFAGAMRASVMDYLLPGRGTIWARYVPTMKPIPVTEGQITDDVAPGDEDEPQPEAIDYEEVCLDYIHWTDFGHNICRTWDEVWLVWRRVYLDREELVNRFGKKLGKRVPLDYAEKNSKGSPIEGANSKATIYECWDKKKKCAVWLHKDLPEYLDLRPDPLELEHFFPCPRFLAANLANDSLIPVPFYVQYQDQADELDTLTGRIASITKSLKVAGVRDASAPGIDRLLSEGVENKLIPVDSWAVLAGKGGLQGVIDLLPIKDIAETLVALYAAREKVKADLYEITGIADIIRGQSDPNETMGAQKIKSNFATLRLSDQQKAVAAFAREVVRLVVDIIGGHFQIETIAQISGVRLLKQAEKEIATKLTQAGQQPPMPPGVTPDQFQQMMQDPTWEEVGALIKNATVRCFRIDIETDSTIKADEQQDKADRIEFLKASGAFLKEAVEAGNNEPDLIPLLVQMLMFGVRAFPVGKQLEGAFNTAIEKLEKKAGSGQPKPNPELQKVQGELQLKTQEMQGRLNLAHQEAQEKIKVAQAEQAAQAAQAQQQNSLEAQREKNKLEYEERLAMAKMQMEGQNDLQKALLDAKIKLAVARIAAGQDNGASEQSEIDLDFNKVFGVPKDDDMHSKMDAILQHLGSQQPPAPQQDLSGPLNAIAQAHRALAGTISAAHQQAMLAHAAHGQTIQDLHKAVTSEKEIVRDPKTGKPTGVRIKANKKAVAAALQQH